MWVFVCMSGMHRMCVVTSVDPLELELQMVVSYPVDSRD